MTGVPVRHTQFASWMDPDAWMESMKGKRWEDVLDEEEKIVKQSMTPEVNAKFGEFQALFSAAHAKSPTSVPFESGPVNIVWHNQFFLEWTARGGNKSHTVRDLATSPSSVWCTEDVGEGAEDFELQYWKLAADKRPSWTKHPVGPEVALQGDRIYYLAVKNKLQYYQLLSCDAETGGSVKIHYNETKPTVNLALEKHSDGRILLICDDSQDITVYEILPSGSLVKRPDRWIVPRSWILPLGKEFGIEFVWPKQGYMITKRHGEKTLWHCGSNHSATKLLHLPAGDIRLDPFGVFEGRLPLVVQIQRPDLGISYYRLQGTSLELVAPILPTGLVSKRLEGRSKDGTAVFGIATYKEHTKPTKLLVVGYGAYGMTTSVGSTMARWAPLVQSGWCVVYTFPRGGGDHTEAWAKAGRRDGRGKTFADVLGILKEAQEEFSIGPSKTAIYGRSAGGLLVGDLLRQDPQGHLFQGAYAEVPYVDELRTTTNPELPLTSLEYNEFGCPTMRLEDFIHIVQTSPADSATVISTPNTFVLTRTAIHDSQVFAYESVKWIRRLRENAPNGAPKLCIVERHQGHFTPPETSLVQWSLDLALLDSWIDSTVR